MSHNPGECPVCYKPFKPGDDKVFCPDCGAPYHRDCYIREGKCLYADKHGKGFEYNEPEVNPDFVTQAERASGTYTPPPREDGGGSRGARGGVVCKVCGTVNDAGHIFCDKCGAPLHAQQPGGMGGGAEGPFGGGGMFGGGYGGPQATADLNGSIDGIPKRDWNDYIGPNAPSYLYRLSLLEQNRGKISFMFSAFFLGPFYFAYRKMWGWAGLTLLFSWAMMVPTILEAMLVGQNPLVAGLSPSLVENLSTVAYLVNIGVQLLMGLFALTLYRRKAGRSIQALRTQHEQDDDYRAALVKHGGTSAIGVIAVVALIFIVGSVLSVYVGDDLMAYFNFLY